MSQIPKDPITVKAAAAMLGCCESHVRLLLSQDKLVGHKVTHFAWLVSLRSVLKYDRHSSGRGRPRAGRKKNLARG